MRYRGGLSYREMAAFLGITHNAVWERHVWALHKLKRQAMTGQRTLGR